MAQSPRVLEASQRETQHLLFGFSGNSSDVSDHFSRRYPQFQGDNHPIDGGRNWRLRSHNGNYEAVNNPSLNAIQDGDTYTVTLDLPSSSVTGPGNYDLIGATLDFSDPAAHATETAFQSINFTVTADGLSDDISLLGCLTTGSSCAVGNELAAYFSIPAAGLNEQNMATGIISGLYPPLNLLEDDGQTDIQSTVAGYSYSSSGNPTPPIATPEPASLSLLSCGLLALLLMRLLRSVRASFSV
jgi:hypothetical protein